MKWLYEIKQLCPHHSAHQMACPASERVLGFESEHWKDVEDWVTHYKGK